MPTSAKPKASRSGNPAKRAESAAPKVATAADFGGYDDDIPLTKLPSGNYVKIDRPGIVVLMTEGLFGDELTSMAQEAVDKAEGRFIEDLKAKVEKDPAMLGNMIMAFDKVAVRCWIDPEVTSAFGTKDDDGNWVPSFDKGCVQIPRSAREPGLLYSDRISMEDKVFTFQYVGGGSDDLATFRERTSESVASLSDGSGAALSAE